MEDGEGSSGLCEETVKEKVCDGYSCIRTTIVRQKLGVVCGPQRCEKGHYRERGDVWCKGQSTPCSNHVALYPLIAMEK